jgi:hypothetical protein
MTPHNLTEPKMKEIFKIEIDCEPGGLRPIHVFVKACSQAGIPIPEGKQWGRFMGNWGFYVSLERTVMERLYESLELLYPSYCRYTGYSVASDSTYEVVKKEGISIKSVMEEWKVSEDGF